MDGLTINEASETTGWSSRMLRYIEREGLIAPRRSPSGYRLYGAEELQRLRTLRELLSQHDLSLGDVGFARRLNDDRGSAATRSNPGSRQRPAVPLTSLRRTGCASSRRSTSVCSPRRANN